MNVGGNIVVKNVVEMMRQMYQPHYQQQIQQVPVMKNHYEVVDKDQLILIVSAR